MPNGRRAFLFYFSFFNIDYCKNGGICVDLWTEKICECPVGFFGIFCQLQNMASFAGNSFLHFPGQNDLSFIGVWISTVQPTGIIWYTVRTGLFLYYHISCK